MALIWTDGAMKLNYENEILMVRRSHGYPGPEVFLGLAYAKCEKTREEKGKTSGEFVSDSWFG